MTLTVLGTGNEYIACDEIGKVIVQLYSALFVSRISDMLNFFLELNYHFTHTYRVGFKYGEASGQNFYGDPLM